MNKHWLEQTRLGAAGSKFFAMGGSTGGSWLDLRARWEHAHAARAALAFVAFAALLLAMKV